MPMHLLSPCVTNLGRPASAGIRHDRRRLVRVYQGTQTQSGDGIMVQTYCTIST